jgi:hypothetical protein
MRLRRRLSARPHIRVTSISKQELEDLILAEMDDLNRDPAVPPGSTDCMKSRVDPGQAVYYSVVQ